MTIDNFADLGVAEPIRRALNVLNLTVPTPIQAQAIPVLLEGRDILATAQTGTGKTAAFALPVMQLLAATRERAKPKSPRALVLAPTRELAVQIGKQVFAFGRHLGLRHTVVFGGVGQGPQVGAMAKGVDILVATPGRLRDLMNQNHIRLDAVKFLVLDEADRMLDMGFIREVRKIVATLPKERQSLLFSATMPPDVAKLAAELLTDPVRIDITPKAVTVDLIDQHVFFVPFPAKRDLLTKLLDDPALSRVIVFTRTKRGADKVAEHLERSRVAAEAIHGNKSQGARQRALEQFRSGRARVLVATDIAARGIDVTGVTHVINYELPNEPESYVHRIGRTARAGASGIAFSFCDPSERLFLRDIERLTKRPLTPRETGLPAATVAAAAVARPAPRGDKPGGRGESGRGQNGGKVVEYPKGPAPRGPRADGARRGRNRRPAQGGSRRPEGADRRRMDG
ncbi:MAG: DEAD/DEAH box helicase [Rhodospirillales bacterium]